MNLVCNCSTIPAAALVHRYCLERPQQRHQPIVHLHIRSTSRIRRAWLFQPRPRQPLRPQRQLIFKRNWHSQNVVYCSEKDRSKTITDNRNRRNLTPSSVVSAIRIWWLRKLFPLFIDDLSSFLSLPSVTIFSKIEQTDIFFVRLST